jgi:hypothetical protein
LGDVIRHANGVVLVVHTPEELMAVDREAIVQSRSGMSGLSDDARRRIPFDRIWCLFEIMTASLAGTPLVMKVRTHSMICHDILIVIMIWILISFVYY